MESVLSGTESNFGTFTEVDEKKTCFFFEEAEGRREKKLVFRGDRRLKVSKLDCGPERTDSILLNTRANKSKQWTHYLELRACIPRVTILTNGSRD